MHPYALIYSLHRICSRFGGGNGYSGGSSGSSSSSSSGSGSSWSGGGSSGGGGSSASFAAGDFLGVPSLGYLVIVFVFFLIRGWRRKQSSKEMDLAMPILVAITGAAIMLVGINFFAGFASIFLAGFASYLGWKFSGGDKTRVNNDRVEPSDGEASVTTESVGSGRSADAGLEQRVRLAWPKLQKAWELQDLDPVRSFLSDGMQARTQAQLDCLSRRGIRNRLENASVEGVEECETVVGSVFTSKTLKIAATGNDIEVDIATGAVKPSAGSNAFSEYWTFLKCTDALAPAQGLLEGVCPNCGAVISVSASVVCEACKSRIKSGRYDWVLTEISQEGAWSKRDREIDQLEREMQTADPGFSVYALEDHASMMFWKLARALSADKVIKPTIPVHPQLQERLKQTWKSPPLGIGFRFEPVVASVEVYRHEAISGCRRMHVRVGWELGPETRFHIGKSADPITKAILSGVANLFKRPDLRGFGEEYLSMEMGGRSAYRVSEYVFERRENATTPVDQNLSTGHCQGCGGPEPVDSAENCPWCGASRPWGDGAWILCSIESGCELLGI